MRTRRRGAILRRCCHCGDRMLSLQARGLVVCEDCQDRGVTVAQLEAAREKEQASVQRFVANCKGLLHGEMHGFGRKA